MDNLSVLVSLKLQKMMFMKECGNRIKQLVSVSSVSQTVLKNRAVKVLKSGRTGATTLEISPMVLSKVKECIFGQMGLDTKVIGLLMKCQAGVRSSGRMVVILKVNLKTE